LFREYGFYRLAVIRKQYLCRSTAATAPPCVAHADFHPAGLRTRFEPPEARLAKHSPPLLLPIWAAVPPRLAVQLGAAAPGLPSCRLSLGLPPRALAGDST